MGTAVRNLREIGNTFRILERGWGSGGQRIVKPGIAALGARREESCGTRRNRVLAWMAGL